jgi:hypothetical protein
MKVKTWVYFYLWRHLGRPIYVGQTSDVVERTKQHLLPSASSNFQKFLKKKISECTCEDLNLRVWDKPQGHFANGIENAIMDLYETLSPSGFNECYSAEKGPNSPAALGSKNQSRDDKVIGGRIAGSIMRDFHRDILISNGAKGREGGCSSRGGKKRIERYGNPATPEGCRKGALRRAHNSHVKNKIKKNWCNFCQESD